MHSHVDVQCPGEQCKLLLSGWSSCIDRRRSTKGDKSKSAEGGNGLVAISLVRVNDSKALTVRIIEMKAIEHKTIDFLDKKRKNEHRYKKKFRSTAGTIKYEYEVLNMSIKY